MSKKIAFIFPGTCVKIPMGESLIKPHPEIAALFETAEAILGRPLKRIMTEGPLEELRRPVNALPATFLASISVFNLLIKKGIRPAVLVGRSLGDITAAAASGAVTFETGMRMVKARGELFAGVSERMSGSMAVIIGMAVAEVRALCKLAERATGGICEIASINTADNCVISGHSSSLSKAVESARQKNALIIPLPLSGPYHSSLMKDTENEFLQILSGFDFQDPVFPIVSEPAGGIIRSGREVFELLSGAAGRCVDWVKRIYLLKDMHIGQFLELGPNQGMAAIAAKLLEGSSGRNIETYADIQSLLQ